MQDTNVVVLVGRLGKDAELKYIGETALAQFSIAVNTSRKNQGTGQYEDEANWIDIELWGKTAESVHRFLTKGKQVIVKGGLKQERWEKDGQNRSKIIVKAQELQLLGGTQQAESTGTQDAPKSAQTVPYSAEDDDCPF